jgi:hypothetical protein
LAKIYVWAFLEKFGKMPFFNASHSPIWVKFYADFEFDAENHFGQKIGFLGFLWVFYDKYIYKNGKL